jgi:hypothetical protein
MQENKSKHKISNIAHLANYSALNFRSAITKIDQRRITQWEANKRRTWTKREDKRCLRTYGVMLKSFTLQDFSITSTASPSPCHLFVHGKLFCESPLSFMLPGFVNLFVHVANSFVNHPFSSCCQVLRIVHCKLFCESPLYVSPGFVNNLFVHVAEFFESALFVRASRSSSFMLCESPLFVSPGSQTVLWITPFLHAPRFWEWPFCS